MPSFHKTRLVPHRAEDMLALVLDVDRYHEFLPWCRRSRVLERGEGVLIGELHVGVGLLSHKFTSRVVYDFARGRVEMRAVRGLFSRFHSWWQIDVEGESACQVEFFIEFQMSLFPFMLNKVFSHASECMVESFEQRANDLRTDLRGLTTRPPPSTRLLSKRKTRRARATPQPLEG